jgi:broad specificity phosphatase PhoE
MTLRPTFDVNILLQVEAFGQYWAPILQKAAAAGKLHVYCSPMRRNLQTAAPLLRELAALGCPVTATVRRDNYEVLGMVHPADRPVLAEVEALAQAGDGGRAELIKLLKTTAWTPAGQSKNEMLAEFPHIALEEGGSGAKYPSDADEGWYSGGFEGAKIVRRRFSEMADWAEGLRDTLAADDVVLCVTHGDMQSRLLNILLARRMGLPDHRQPGPGEPPMDTQYLGWHAGSNTSVSLLSMNPPGAMLHPGAPAQEWGIEFSHRLDHLGPESEPDTLMRGYKYLGLLSPTNEERKEGVGYWGLRIVPKL